MNRALLMLSAMAVFAGLASANVLCVNANPGGLLSDYIANNATFGQACQMGDKLFWNFGLANGVHASGGEPTAASINVQAIPGLTNVGIQFTGGWIVSHGQIMDSVISYRVGTVSGSSAIDDATLGITGTLSTSGSAGATETLTGVPGSPLHTALPSSTSAYLVFGGSTFSSRSVSDEIQVTGGTGFGNIAHISIVQNNFYEIVPEPYATVLIGSGLLALGLLRRRQPRR
jgi:hypothetical protein